MTPFNRKFDNPSFRRLEKAVEANQRFRPVKAYVSFRLRKQKNPSVFTICTRLTINGKRSADISTGLYVGARQFNRRKIIIAGDPFNSGRLQELKATIQQIFSDRLMTGRDLDPKTILNIAFGLRGHDEALPTIIEAMKLHLERMEKRAARNDLSAGSLSRYRTYIDILTRFFTLHPGYSKNMVFNELKPALAQHLIDDYLKLEKGYCHNYAKKIFEFLRSLIDMAVAENWADRNPVKHIRVKKYHKPPVNLTLADLDKLQNFDFVEVHAAQTRDVFLFCCYSGLAYADVASLRPAHLVEVDGITCIVKERAKSGQQAFVPLFPEARVILERYRSHEGARMKGVLLPTLSNCKMNNWLKVIGNVAGVSLPLHTHLARKTFTVFAEERGFTLTEMSVMMAHSHSTMTEKFYYQKRREPVVTRFKSLYPRDDQQQAG